MDAKNGGPAFPIHGGWGTEPRHQILGGGMSLKDYFAAHALQGLLAYYGNPSHRYDEIAMQAYTFAEAMIDEGKQNDRST